MPPNSRQDSIDSMKELCGHEISDEEALASSRRLADFFELLYKIDQRVKKEDAEKTTPQEKIALP